MRTGARSFEDRHRGRSRRLPSAKRLFQQLDHQVVGTPTDHWIIEVTAIQVVGNDTWVQLAPIDDPSNGLMLHLSGDAPLDRILVALTEWSTIPSDQRPGVLDIN